jgi:hypothetical protein
MAPCSDVGIEKERYMRGLSRVDKAVCAKCFEGDETLRDLVIEAASELKCDFCNRRSRSKPIAAPIDVVVDYIEECISQEYEDPVEHVGWDSEMGWGITPMDTSDLLQEVLFLLNDDDGELHDALCEGLGRDREWVRQNPYGSAPEEAYIWSWRELCAVVKHKRRFFFHNERDRTTGELYAPQELLDHIARFCVDNGLVRDLRAST